MVYPILSRIGYRQRYAERSQLSVVTYHGVLPAGYRIGTVWLSIAAIHGDDYPRRSGVYVTEWYYYVFEKNEASANAPCA
jgi:hypothetical protein